MCGSFGRTVRDNAADAKSAFALGSNAYTVAFGRFITGAFFLGLYLMVHPGSTLKVSPAQLKRIAVLSLFFSAIPYLLYASYQYIDSGLATTLHFTYPVAVVLISAFLFRSRISTKSILCILICIAGILCLYTPGGTVDPRGAFLAAASGVVYAGYIVGVEKSGLKSIPVLNVIFWLALFSAVEVLVFGLFTDNLRFDIPKKVWILYAGLGLIAMVLAATLFQIGILRCGAVKSSMLSTVEPVTGVLIGAIVFKEVLTLRSIAGIILILLAVCILALPGSTG